MLQWFSEKRQEGVAWLLLFLLCFAVVEIPVQAWAGFLPTGLYEKSFDPDTNEFIIFGRHNYTDGKNIWTYRTKAFNVASKECSDITNPPSTVKVARLAIKKNLSSLEVSGDDLYTKSTYVMQGYDFANAFQTLYAEGIADAVANGQKTFTEKMYFNNIFQVVYRTDPGITGYYTDAIMNPQYSTMSTEEYHTAAAIAANSYVSAWTPADFAGFYNYPYEYTVNILEATINYVDKKTGKDIRPSVAKVYGLKGGNGRYTLPEKTILVGDKSYVYDGTYAIDYKNSSSPAIAHSSDGNFSWTFMNDYMEIDVYFTEEERNKVPIRILTETGTDTDGYTVVKSVDYPEEMYEGETFSYTPDEFYTDASGKRYTYKKEWHYSYTDKNGNVKESGINPGGNINPKIISLPEVKEGTRLNVYVRYEKEPADIKIKINTSISEDGETFTVARTKDYAKALKPGDSFSYAAPTTFKFGGKIYNYIKEWYYTYINPSGADKKVEGTGANPSIPSLPKVKEDTALNVYIKYSLTAAPTPSGEPTPSTEPTPSAEPTATPTPSPSPTPTPVKKPSSDQDAPPNKGVIEKQVAIPTSAAVIESEIKNNQRYVARTSIATQEDLYTEGTATEFTIGYRFNHITGTVTYPIEVRKTYILKWETTEIVDGEEVTEIESTERAVSTVVYVRRGYGYWEIDNFKYYVADNMTLYNYALPNSTSSMSAITSKMNLPRSASEDFSENLRPPSEAVNGITLPSETLFGGKSVPAVPYNDFRTLAHNAAHSMTGDIKVRNDYLMYDNGTVLNSAWNGYCTSDAQTMYLARSFGPTIDALFYKGNQVIDAEKNNGVYQSDGTIRYRATSSSIAAAPTVTYDLTKNPEQVVLHTPVHCKGVVTADNEGYVQLVNPNRTAIQLVLDEDDTLNDFLVRVDNTGEHNPYTGYGTRDYSKILRLPSSNLSNIAKDTDGVLRNEVKFPFDVYKDVGNDRDSGNDVYYPAGTWFTLGTGTQRFYIPLTVREGIYAADFRTVAVNFNGRIDSTEPGSNLNRNHYVATDTVAFEVSGRVYGLNIYDINDYPIWEEVFRVPKTKHLKLNKGYPLGVSSTVYDKYMSYNYTVGTSDQYGNSTGRNAKFTFPLTAGSHPYYGNVGILKRGYTARFSLDTIGTFYSDDARVEVYPTFYWVDKNGQNRTKVDLYYSAEVEGKSRSLIKSGEVIDLANIVSYTAGDRNLGIPEDELNITAALRNIAPAKWLWEYADMVYGVSKVVMTAPFRTYTGTDYKNAVMSGPNKARITAAGVSEADLIITKQSWYGEVFIPGNARAVNAGYDVFGYAKRYGIDYTEDFWKKDGYIIVNLDIRVHDNGRNVRLSYINKPNEAEFCNMWRMEHAPISKSSVGGPAFYFEDGDFLLYSVEQSATDDYVVGGIY